MKVVLLAAGFGSRLWPLSTSAKPKQFQMLLGEQSPLQYTYQLFSHIVAPQDIYILTLRGLEHWVYEQIPGIQSHNILLVPERRNTLPHTLFALHTLAESAGEPILFSGTDVIFEKPDDFTKTVAACVRAHTDSTAEISLICSDSDTTDLNAGYAQIRDSRVTAFVEKPDTKTIETLATNGRLGRSMFTYVISLDALRNSLPGVDQGASAAAQKLLDSNKPDMQESFLEMPVCDISGAVFTSAPNMTACICSSDFTDLGSYRTLHHINKKDENNNVIFGEVILEGSCANNFIVNQTSQPLVVIDTSSAVIVQTPEGNLYAPIDQANRVGEIYKQKIHERPT